VAEVAGAKAAGVTMKQAPRKRPPTVIVLDLADEREATDVAKALADKIGCQITVKTRDGIEIETVGPTKH